MTAAVCVENVSKRYRVRPAAGVRYRTLRDDLMRALAWPLRRLRAGFGQGPADFWALRDVNLEVRPGERVGIIGRNGAGKSTLLKILSRVTRPSAGRVRLRGRVTSLLEVGTGFHPELTGRENIFLSAAIQGMGRAEVRRKFDDIVAFSEVANFLDTPVKRYSSGMYVRLAFAVAAHLDPDVLIVDEVLAVGDAAFQKKCLGRMGENARQGKTVLFVSHNMQALRSLCDRGVVLENGRVATDTTIEQAIPAYLRALRGAALTTAGQGDRLNRTSGAVQLEQVDARDARDQSRWVFSPGETVRLVFTYRAAREVPSLGFYLALRSGIGNDVITTFKEVVSAGPVAAGVRGEIRLELPDLALRPGEYSVYACLGDAACARFYDVVDDNVSLPWLVVHSAESDPHRLAGWVTLPARVTSTQCGITSSAPL